MSSKELGDSIMVKSEVVNRVLRIRYNGSRATTFSLEKSDVQYLVTAKHIFEKAGFPAICDIELLLDAGYIAKKVRVFYHQISTVDIAVMQTVSGECVTQKTGTGYTSNDLLYSQDTFFLGFPFAYDEMLDKLPGRGIPMPFVKKACVSAFYKDNDDIQWLLLDGLNNPGFSGGPVCFQPHNDKTMRICGVVCSYRTNMAILRDVNGNEFPFYTQENTGIMYACDISHAFEIIDAIN